MTPKGTKLSEEHKKKISEALKGKPNHWRGKKHSEETKRKIAAANKGKETWNKGVPRTIEYRRKLSEMEKGKNGSNWKGGITPKEKIIRTGLEYRLWRDAVKARDNYTCVWCGSKERIEADHIQEFNSHPDLRFAIDNGRTLCKPCHKKRHAKGLNN